MLEKEKSIFATLTYSHSLERKFITIDSQKLHLQSLFNFVAIKNGEHNQKGFVFPIPNLMIQKKLIFGIYLT